MPSEEEAYRDAMAESARNIMERANDEVRLREHDYVMPQHILKAICELDREMFDREVKGMNLEPTSVVKALDAKLAQPHETPHGCVRIVAQVNGVEVPTYPAPCHDVLFAALTEAQKEGRPIESRDLLASLCKGGFSFVRELVQRRQGTKLWKG